MTPPTHFRMVKLYDGREAANDSEDWRHECEARHIIGLADPAARRAMLAGVERKRGIAERERLQETIAALLLRREAERVIAMPSLRARREHLELVEYERGGTARRELEDEIRRIWPPRKAA